MPVIRDLLTRIGFAIDPTGIRAITGAGDAAKTQMDSVAASAREASGELREAGSGIAAWVKGILGLAAIKTVLGDFAAEAKAALLASQSLGLSTGWVQTWQRAGQTVGVASEQITASMAKIASKAQEAIQGNAETAMTFRRLGVDVKGADGKVAPMEILLNRISDGFAGITDPAKRTNLAMKLFEESGPKLLPVLMKGSKGMAQLRGELEKAGVIMSQAALQDARRFSEAMGKLRVYAVGFRNALALQVLPAITDLISGFMRWVRQGERMSYILHAVKVAAMAAGAAMAYMAGAAIVGKIGALVTVIRAVYAAFWSVGGAASVLLSPVVLVAAAIAGLVLLIDDLYALASGGNSALGEVLNPKDANAAISVVRGLWDVIKALWVELKALGKVLGEAFGELARALGFKDLGTMLKATFKLLALIVAAFIFGAVMIIKGLIQVFKAVVEGFVVGFKFIGDVAATVWQAIKDTISAFIQLFVDLGRTIASEFGRLKKWFSETIATPVLDGIRKAWDAVAAAAQKAYDIGKSAIELFTVGKGKGLIDPFMQGGKSRAWATGDDGGIRGIGGALMPPTSTAPGKSVTITGGPITVNGANADPAEIARMVRAEQQAQFDQLVSDSMGDFAEEAP